MSADKNTIKPTIIVTCDVCKKSKTHAEVVTQYGVMHTITTIKFDPDCGWSYQTEEDICPNCLKDIACKEKA